MSKTPKSRRRPPQTATSRPARGDDSGVPPEAPEPSGGATPRARGGTKARAGGAGTAEAGPSAAEAGSGAASRPRGAAPDPSAAAPGSSTAVLPGAADGSAGPPPLRLTAAAAVAAAEGLGVAAWGVTLLFGGGKAVIAGLMVLALAALPLAAAYGLRKARRWSRGPALIIQLLSLPVAWTMLHSSGVGVPAGILLGALSIAGLVLLVHPAATDALGISRTRSS